MPVSGFDQSSWFHWLLEWDLPISTGFKRGFDHFLQITVSGAKKSRPWGLTAFRLASGGLEAAGAGILAARHVVRGILCVYLSGLGEGEQQNLVDQR